MSNFSFYYAHHMSTIEGGMICTDDPAVYEQARMLRSHGMVREAISTDVKARYQSENPELNPDFIFAFPAYNVRNTEVGAILGINQLKRLDKNVELRTQNMLQFLSLIDADRFRIDFEIEGSSNYAFNLILKEPDHGFAGALMEKMRKGGVEFRRGSAGGGNQLRQPYLRNLLPQEYYRGFPETEHIHFFGFYIGNFPDLSTDEIRDVCAVLNL